jgi:peptide-methionine (S)-S-oxide reductase
VRESTFTVRYAGNQASRSLRVLLMSLAASWTVAGFDGAAAASGSQTAVLAGGCYWGVEAVFEHVKGVEDVVSGFAGGRRDPMAAQPGAAPAGAAEAVRITFDPRQISYAQLLQIFMTVAHDPTQLNRQGPDIGTRYRSAIFPRDKSQRQAAETLLVRLRATNRYPKPIVTRIETGAFTPAPPAEQNFVQKHPNSTYVVVNDLPKLDALKRTYPQLWRS